VTGAGQRAEAGLSEELLDAARQVRPVLHVEERRGAAERGGVVRGDLEVSAVAVARGLLERVGTAG